MNMVFWRPIWSETKPKKGRGMPFGTHSKERANVSVGKVRPSNVTFLHKPRIAGIDEVGRGPLAGPVVAVAVVLPDGFPTDMLDDSKKLSAAKRETVNSLLRTTPGVEIGIGAASVGEILRLNILQANFLAMRRALARLGPVDLALVDGNADPGLPCRVRCVIGGDGSEPAISAASIIAKVLRDRLMARLALRYPGYGWERNAGYGTQVHLDALRTLGATPHHRAGFAPVRQLGLTI